MRVRFSSAVRFSLRGEKKKILHQRYKKVSAFVWVLSPRDTLLSLRRLTGGICRHSVSLPGPRRLKGEPGPLQDQGLVKSGGKKGGNESANLLWHGGNPVTARVCAKHTSMPHIKAGSTTTLWNLENATVNVHPLYFDTLADESIWKLGPCGVHKCSHCIITRNVKKIGDDVLV